MGALIADALREDGLTQVDLARRVGVTQKHVSQVLTGQAAATVKTFENWATAINRSWDVYLCKNDE